MIAIAREQGGLEACEALPDGSWPYLLAEWKIRQEEAEAHGKKLRQHQRPTGRR